MFTAIVSLTAIGAVCAILLSLASRLMYAAFDERIPKIRTALPGTNCGACGFPHCEGYAHALVENEDVKGNLCLPGGAEVLDEISKVLGVRIKEDASKVAFVHCFGDKASQQKKMDYFGIRTCFAAQAVYFGEGACSYGCIGYGDCEAACPAGAVCMDSGLARVNANLCVGCALCAKACPQKIIMLENREAKAHVACSSSEDAEGKAKRCAKGCAACGKCVEACAEKAIAIEGNRAIIAHALCSSCGACAKVCLPKCVALLA